MLLLGSLPPVSRPVLKSIAYILPLRLSARLEIPRQANGALFSKKVTACFLAPALVLLSGRHSHDRFRRHCRYFAAPAELPLVAPDEAAADFVGQIQIANLYIQPFEFLAASRQGRPNVALRRDSSLRRCFRQSLHMFRSCACLRHASIRRELNLNEVTFLPGSGTVSPCSPRRGRRRGKGRPNVALRRDSSLRRCFRQRLQMLRSCECLLHLSELAAAEFERSNLFTRFRHHVALPTP